MGFEPTTFCMASRRSSQLSYSRAAPEYSPGSRARQAPDRRGSARSEIERKVAGRPIPWGGGRAYGGLMQTPIVLETKRAGCLDLGDLEAAIPTNSPGGPNDPA